MKAMKGLFFSRACVFFLIIQNILDNVPQMSYCKGYICILYTEGQIQSKQMKGKKDKS